MNLFGRPLVVSMRGIACWCLISIYVIMYIHIKSTYNIYRTSNPNKLTNNDDAFEIDLDHDVFSLHLIEHTHTHMLIVLYSTAY